MDLTLGTPLRAALRQDPDVIMLGEIRDGETAMWASQKAPEIVYCILARLRDSRA
jgi:type II secretory ATPase GspE/PulE/Tfp pilus assembly ATPase PilB-like protein